VHGARGMGLGAWGLGLGAWGLGHIAIAPLCRYAVVPFTKTYLSP